MASKAKPVNTKTGNGVSAPAAATPPAPSAQTSVNNETKSNGLNPAAATPPAPSAQVAKASVGNGTKSNGSMNGSYSEDDANRSMTPTKLSRLDEKNALVGLNDRLAVILDRNRQLEVENSKLNGQLHSAEETLVVTTNKLKQTFEKENVDIRKRLEAVEKEKVKLDLNGANLLKDFNDVMTKLQNRDKDLTQAQKLQKDTEAKLNHLAGDCKKLQDEKDKLLKDKKEVADENASLKKGLDELRKKLEGEALAKVSLEAAVRDKGEELQLKSQIYQQEVAVLISKKQTEVQQVGDRLEKEYQAKLEEAIKSLRDECNQQILANKEDQENLYNMKEDNLKKQMEKGKAGLKDKADEVANIVKKLGDAEKKIMALDGDKYNLQQNLKDVEKKWKDDQSRADKEKKGLEKELDQVQDDKEKLINEYQDLMEVKVALDNEIAVYRRLLEGEEERLKITLTKTPEKKQQKELEKQIAA